MRKLLACFTAIMLAALCAFGAPAEGISVGDKVTFGSWPQGADGEVLPIDWTVIDVAEDGACLLLSDRILTSMPYNDEYAETTWRKCSLRKWLNGGFLESAFSSDERAAIIETHVINDGNVKYRTTGGKDTDDYVFLLSLGELMGYYSITQKQFRNEHEELMSKPTEYAIAGGAVAFRAYGDEAAAKYEGNGSWWLRSPGCGREYAAFVNMEGKVLPDGYLVDFTLNGVRPAVWAKLQ